MPLALEVDHDENKVPFEKLHQHRCDEGLSFQGCQGVLDELLSFEVVRQYDIQDVFELENQLVGKEPVVDYESKPVALHSALVVDVADSHEHAHCDADIDA